MSEDKANDLSIPEDTGSMIAQCPYCFLAIRAGDRFTSCPSCKKTFPAAIQAVILSYVDMQYDVFISYATEDKDDVARPLSSHLAALGYSVWFDELTLKMGDSLRRTINKGLSTSRFGVVILSHHFLQKNWPQYELDGLTQRELANGEKVILPLWHNITPADIARYSLPLADKVGLVSSTGLETIAMKISEVIGRPINNPDETWKQSQCSKCGQLGRESYNKKTDFGVFNCLYCGNVELWGMIIPPLTSRK